MTTCAGQRRLTAESAAKLHSTLGVRIGMVPLDRVLSGLSKELPEDHMLSQNMLHTRCLDIHRRDLAVSLSSFTLYLDQRLTLEVNSIAVLQQTGRLRTVGWYKSYTLVH